MKILNDMNKAMDERNERQSKELAQAIMNKASLSNMLKGYLIIAVICIVFLYLI